MANIARLKANEISPGNTIAAADIEAELDQIVNELNSKETRLDDLEGSNMTIAGDKTFSGNTIFSNPIKLTGTPDAAGELGYASNTLKYHNGTSVINVGNPITTVVAKSALYTAAAADNGALHTQSGTYTVSLTAAATLGSSWFLHVRNIGTGVITIDPNSSETIDGLASITIGPNNACTIICDGTNFVTLGRAPEYINLRDEKAAGTNGGTFTNGAWRTRDLNVEAFDTGNNCALSSNAFTLQPGTYRIQASAPARICGAHHIKLRNTSDGSDVLIGNQLDAGTADNTSNRVTVEGQFSITAAKTFEIQHQCQTTSANNSGFGLGNNFSVVEVFTVVELWKVV